jgi:hypothetical protein
MIYLRSIVGGLAASMMGAFVFTMAYAMWMVHRTQAAFPGQAVAVSWDLRSGLSPQFLILLAIASLVSFAAGFWIVWRFGGNRPIT